MIDNLPVYPAYRGSELPWVGAIPAHWEEERGKCYFREVDDPDCPAYRCQVCWGIMRLVWQVTSLLGGGETQVTSRISLI